MSVRFVDLDPGDPRLDRDVHRFYMRERMAITSFHFGKPLE